MMKRSVSQHQREREREYLRAQVMKSWTIRAERQDPGSDFWRGKAYAACIALKDEIGKAAADAFIDTFPERFSWKWAYERLSEKLDEEKIRGHHG